MYRNRTEQAQAFDELPVHPSANTLPATGSVSPATPRIDIINEDALAKLKRLPPDSVHVCVTSPPYFRQRKYGGEGEIGREETIEDYVRHLVEVFSEVRRVLHPTGSLWLNVGDSYSNAATQRTSGVRAKSLCMIPDRLVLALMDNGWIVRSQIAWCKTAPMPSSVKDRPTPAWEPVFLLTKNPDYFYDAEAVKVVTPVKNGSTPRQHGMRNYWTLGPDPYHGSHCAPYPRAIPRTAITAGTSERGCCPKCLASWERVIKKTRRSGLYGGLRKRADAPGAVTSPTSVFRNGDGIATSTERWQPTCDCGISYTVPCTVLDPFGGSGTTGMVAKELGRSAILIELNPDYCIEAEVRCKGSDGKGGRARA